MQRLLCRVAKELLVPGCFAVGCAGNSAIDEQAFPATEYNPVGLPLLQEQSERSTRLIDLMQGAFPDVHALERLVAEGPSPRSNSTPAGVDVAEWRLAPTDEVASPVPTWLELVEGRSPGGTRSIASEETCAAREVARFYAAHGALPTGELAAFLAGACGLSDVVYLPVAWAVPAQANVSAVNRERWRDEVANTLDEKLPREGIRMGAARYRVKGEWFESLVATPRKVEWEQRSPIADSDGRVVWKGRLRLPARGVRALINRGERDVEPCQVEHLSGTTRFTLTCKLAPKDDSAWIEVRTQSALTDLSHRLARFQVKRSDATLTFQLNATAASDDDFERQIANAVNEERALKGAGPVRLASKMSPLRNRLAREFFSTDDEQVHELILDGLAAGWDAPGTVLSAAAVSETLHGSRDGARWVRHALQFPGARELMMDSRVDVIAVGADLSEEGGPVASAAIAGYQLYDTHEERLAMKLFVARVNHERNQRGLSPVVVRSTPEMRAGLAHVKSAHHPENALRMVMNALAEQSKNAVTGGWIETIGQMPFDVPEMLLQPKATLFVGATHHRYPGTAWGVLTMLVVVANE